MSLLLCRVCLTSNSPYPEECHKRQLIPSFIVHISVEDTIDIVYTIVVRSNTDDCKDDIDRRAATNARYY